MRLPTGAKPISSLWGAIILRKILFSVGLTAALVLGFPMLASASVIESAVPTADDLYPPAPPKEPTLAGSFAVGTCEADVPWIHYSVALTDPDLQSTSDEAFLIMTDGTNSVTIPLGTIVMAR